MLVPSIGGGVCQAATTVFDAAFSGGYDITHRLNHSFYISHYPLGMDATVADTGPDFTFVNDTEERDRDQGHREPRDDDRRLPLAPARPHVEKSSRRRRPTSSPKKRYYASPDVPDGTVTQTTHGERGFKVTVSRTVTAPTARSCTRTASPRATSPRTRST